MQSFTQYIGFVWLDLSASISDKLYSLRSLQLFPSHIPDFCMECPLIVSGRYGGNFDDSVQVSGTMADTSNFIIELKAQNAKDIPLDRVMSQNLLLLVI